jgi:hypothetical protein
MPTAVDSACQMGVRFAVLTTDLTGTLFDLEARALWAAKCLTKCTDAAGQEVGCDVYHLRVISIQTKLLI